MPGRQLRTSRNTINLHPNIWDTTRFRNLPATTQWLYLTLHRHQDLNQAGIIEWHPARLAAMTNDLKAEDITTAGQQLETTGYLTIDTDTQEAYINGYNAKNRWLKSPTVGIAVGTAAQKTHSRKIRHTLKQELSHLTQQNPNNSALQTQPILDLLTE